MSKIKVAVCGTGSYVPQKVVYNHDLADCDKLSWIESVLGIRERRRIEKGETPSDMAVKAAKKALDMAEIKPQEVDLLIAATITPDRIVPSAGTTIQRKLGACNAVAFDVNAACAGYVFSMITAEQFLLNGYFENALVIGVDALSVLTDYQDRTCVYYGDGAGATVLRRTRSNNGIISSYFKSDGQGIEHVYVEGGMAENPISKDVLDKRKHYLIMKGKEVGVTAEEVIPHAIETALKKANITSEQLKYLVPHQPNLTLLRRCAEKVNIPEEKIVITLDKYANMSSANIPVALDKINSEGLLEEGDLIAMATIGAGWTWASMILQWGA